MSFWNNEADFLRDLDLLSFDSNLAESRRHAYRTSPFQASNKEHQQMWYDDDDDDDYANEDDDNCDQESFQTETEPKNHLQTMNEIRREVRNTVGSCYHNDRNEIFCRILQNENLMDTKEDLKTVPKQTIEHATKNIDCVSGAVKKSKSLNGHVQSLSSMLSKSKQYNGRACKRTQNVAQLSSNNIDIKSDHEFPAL